MDEAARKRLVSEWVEHHDHQMAWDSNLVLHRQSLNPGAADELDKISYSDPNLCLDLLIEIVHASQSDDVMSSAAAPLQRLLETESPEFVERVEAVAHADSRFRELLAWMLPLDANTELWNRVRKVAGNVEW